MYTYQLALEKGVNELITIREEDNEEILHQQATAIWTWENPVQSHMCVKFRGMIPLVIEKVTVALTLKRLSLQAIPCHVLSAH